MVVVSIATHSTPRLSEMTTTHIAAIVSCISAPNRRARCGVVVPAINSVRKYATLYVLAIVPTAPIRMTISALTASARNWPAAVETGPLSRTWAASVMPRPVTVRHETVGSHAVAGCQPATAMIAATAAGTMGRSRISVAISRAALATGRDRYHRTWFGCGW